MEVSIAILEVLQLFSEYYFKKNIFVPYFVFLQFFFLFVTTNKMFNIDNISTKFQHIIIIFSGKMKTHNIFRFSIYRQLHKKRLIFNKRSILLERFLLRKYFSPCDTAILFIQTSYHRRSIVSPRTSQIRFPRLPTNIKQVNFGTQTMCCHRTGYFERFNFSFQHTSKIL